MTDTPTPSTESEDDDLLPSLYLDGEATAEERAQVEASPELMARVRSFEAVAQQLAAVTPPAGLREAQIESALALFDQRATSSEVASITSLDAKRHRHRSGGVASWLGAAAALALVVGGIGFVASGGLGSSNDEAATADIASDDADTVSPSGANRATTTSPDSGEAMSDEAMSDEAMDAELAEAEMAEAEMATDGADDAGAEAADMDEATEETDEAMEAPAGEAGLAPIELDQYSATTAAGFYEFVVDVPPLPIEASPCADSPLVLGIIGVDSYLPVVFEGELASLLFRNGDSSTAVIVGPACEIALD